MEKPLLKPNTKKIENPVLQKRLQMIKEGCGNVEMRLMGEGYEVSGNRGEIINALDGPEDKRMMIVRTDTGAIVPKNRETITERLSGCVGLLIRGPGFNYLVHMTPSGTLGYYYHRYQNSKELMKASVARILSKLPDNILRDNLSAKIITNVPNETDGVYGRQKLEQAWGGVMEEIVAAGITDCKIIELPLDETTLYFTPLIPDYFYAVGKKTEIGEGGNYIFHPDELDDQFVSIT